MICHRICSLPFQELYVNIGRDRYIEILEEKCNYRKNDPKLFELLKANTEIAVMRAKKQYCEYATDTPPSQRCHATRIFELVKELLKFL